MIASNSRVRVSAEKSRCPWPTSAERFEFRDAVVDAGRDVEPDLASVLGWLRQDPQVSVGDSYDNALAETVIGLFKTEESQLRPRTLLRQCSPPRMGGSMPSASSSAPSKWSPV